MSLQRIFHQSAPVKSKRYDLYLVLTISFLILFHCYPYVFRREEKTRSDALMTMNYEDRSDALIGSCKHSNSSFFNVSNCVPNDLVSRHPWLNAALFPLRSRSLMYCAIPKIASKTLISIIMYVYVRDVLNHLTGNMTHHVVNSTRAEQYINIRKLTEQLLKVPEIWWYPSSHFSHFFLVEWYPHSPSQRAEFYYLLTANVSSPSAVWNCE